MTVIEQPVIEDKVATIDPMFDDNDHFICCDTSNDFVGSTVTFCGKTIFEAFPESTHAVGCADCMEAAKTTLCPLGHLCNMRMEENGIWVPV